MNYIAGAIGAEALLLPEVLDDYITRGKSGAFHRRLCRAARFGQSGFRHAQLPETGRPPYDPGRSAPALSLRLSQPGALQPRAGAGSGAQPGSHLAAAQTAARLQDHRRLPAGQRPGDQGGRAGSSPCSAASWSYSAGELVAIDSTKIKAQNAKGRNYSEAKLQALLAEIDKKVSAVLGGAGSERRAEEARAATASQSG